MEPGSSRNDKAFFFVQLIKCGNFSSAGIYPGAVFKIVVTKSFILVELKESGDIILYCLDFLTVRHAGNNTVEIWRNFEEGEREGKRESENESESERERESVCVCVSERNRKRKRALQSVGSLLLCAPQPQPLSAWRGEYQP